MARNAPWRRQVSDAVSWHQDEALNSTIYILRDMGPTGFLLKEDGEPKKFKVWQFYYFYNYYGIKKSCKRYWNFVGSFYRNMITFPLIIYYVIIITVADPEFFLRGANHWATPTTLECLRKTICYRNMSSGI